MNKPLAHKISYSEHSVKIVRDLDRRFYRNRVIGLVQTTAENANALSGHQNTDECGMTEKPILFSAPMVRAILAGQKTQTRRVLKRQPPEGARYTGVHYASHEPDSWFFNSPSGPFKCRAACDIDDTLWVRESFRARSTYDGTKPRDLSPNSTVIYEADAKIEGLDVGKLRPGIFMPRWASRITLEVTDVRVRRLQDISEEDAKAEGVERMKSGRGYYSTKYGHAAVHFGVYHDYAKEAFADLWDVVNGDGAWGKNPWVFAVTFSVASAQRQDEERSDTTSNLANTGA